MKHLSIVKILITGAVIVSLASCSKKLDLFPQNEFTSETAYANADGYRSVLAKVYGGLATTGNTGPAGSSDIQGLDEGPNHLLSEVFLIARNCQRMKQLLPGMTRLSKIFITSDGQVAILF